MDIKVDQFGYVVWADIAGCIRVMFQVAGDMLFQDHKFDVGQVINYFHLKGGHLAIYYEMETEEVASTRGIVEVSSSNK